jgi:hypothetical protein
MTPETSQSCPDCAEPLQPIAILDRADYNIPLPLQYRAVDAKRGWLGQYPIAGNVEALMCSSCGRILLYGISAG